jgi:hypothetical protein
MDDISLAALMGEAPATPDPAFRLDVFARVSARRRRRAAAERAVLQIAGFTAVGLLLALIQSAGIQAHALAPVLGVAGALAAVGAFAFTVIAGPKAALARVRAAF